MNVIKGFDPVILQQDVLELLDKVNHHQTHGLFAELVVKKPLQLGLVCFSAASSLLAACREIFAALGDLSLWATARLFKAVSLDHRSEFAHHLSENGHRR